MTNFKPLIDNYSQVCLVTRAAWRPPGPALTPSPQVRVLLLELSSVFLQLYLSLNQYLVHLSSPGLCYNELECLAGGGSITGYCAPAALGVCCVFRHKGCGRTIKQKISYFTNPNYPLQDRKPIACLLKGRA